MKLVVLSTDTLHHAFIVREIAKAHPVELVISELRSLSPPFETHHEFEDNVEEYYKKAFTMPLHPGLEQKDIDYICEQIHEVLS